MEFELALAGTNLCPLTGIEWLLVDGRLLDYHWRGKRIGLDVVRVDLDHAAKVGKEQLSVLRLPACRLRTTVALGILHAVGKTIRSARHSCNSARSELFKLLFADAENAFVGTHPKVFVAIFKNGIYEIIKQSVLDRISGELPIFESLQTTIQRANPKRTLLVFID